MHEESNSTCKITNSLANIVNGGLNTSNDGVAIVSTSSLNHVASAIILQSSNSIIHEVASSSTLQTFPALLTKQNTDNFLNESSEKMYEPKTPSPIRMSSVIASSNNQSNVIITTNRVTTDSSDYLSNQMLTKNDDLPINVQLSNSIPEVCHVTIVPSISTSKELTTLTADNVAGSLSEIVEAPSTASNNELEFDIRQDMRDCATDNADGYNESSSSSQFPNISLFPTGLADQTDLKDLIEELCPVCGDKVSGYHYGLLTCESCKGFFKRTVQNKKVYTCVAERQCHIDKTQRKRCPFCRFQKCLEVGMKLEAVRADRMRGGRNKFGPMYKRDRARKLQIARQRQLALQALRGSMSGSEGLSQLSPSSYQQHYPSMQIKQEIQIPQVSSLTSSPDSSPSPIAIALGQVTNQVTATTLASMCQNTSNNSSTTAPATLPTQLSETKVWMANTTTVSPHSISPKTFNFDTSTILSNSASTNNSAETLRVSPMIREFVQSVDDREWSTSLFSLLQSQSYNQCEVDLFELMCKVLDQNLFSQVDWARNTIFFKDLKVDDQMKLLQNSWSDMLVLDHLHQRIHNNLPDETTLHNGQKFDLLGLGLLGVPVLADKFVEIQNKLVELKFDVGDYICMKFLLLLNPEVRGIANRKTVVEGYENVQAALLDYTLTCYPSVTDKFAKLLSIIPEIHVMASRGEEHLYIKHCAGSAPSQTLLMEMLHAKRK